MINHPIKRCFLQSQSRKKLKVHCLGQVNIVLGQVKMEVRWSSGQVKLASVVLLDGNFQSSYGFKMKKKNKKKTKTVT